jgi:hypothetical protein
MVWYWISILCGFHILVASSISYCAGPEWTLTLFYSFGVISAPLVSLGFIIRGILLGRLLLFPFGTSTTLMMVAFLAMSFVARETTGFIVFVSLLSIALAYVYKCAISVISSPSYDHAKVCKDMQCSKWTSSLYSASL